MNRFIAALRKYADHGGSDEPGYAAPDTDL